MELVPVCIRTVSFLWQYKTGSADFMFCSHCQFTSFFCSEGRRKVLGEGCQRRGKPGVSRRCSVSVREAAKLTAWLDSCVSLFVSPSFHPEAPWRVFFSACQGFTWPPGHPTRTPAVMWPASSLPAHIFTICEEVSCFLHSNLWLMAVNCWARVYIVFELQCLSSAVPNGKRVNASASPITLVTKKMEEKMLNALQHHTKTHMQTWI